MIFQLCDEGYTSTKSNSTGRRHTNWLNMIYPRLCLSRNLLKEDGVIFVSIDEDEVHNLRKVMYEIYGEENLFETRYFDFPKPTLLLKEFIKQSTSDNDIKVQKLICYEKALSTNVKLNLRENLDLEVL